MATAGEIITDALTEAGVLRAGQSPSPERLAYGLSRLNRLVGQYSSGQLYIFGTNVDIFTIGTTKAEYTLGPSGDFVLGRNPARVDQMNLLLVNDTRIPINCRISREEYGAIVMKALQSSYPVVAWCDPGQLNIGIRPWPIPQDTSLRFEFFTPESLQQFNSTSDTLQAPQGYQESLTSILAEVICTGLPGVQATQDIRENARRARMAMLDYTTKAGTIMSDTVGLSSSGTNGGGYFNYKTGQVVGRW